MELKGTLVVLRPIHRGDVAALLSMFSEPAVARWWWGFDRDHTEKALLDNDDDDTTVYTIEVDEEVAGVIQCYEEPDPRYRSAALDIAVATKWHGRGVAVDALRTLARDLLERRGHHHLTIDPAADNARAIACYAKVGFRPVGVLRRNELGEDGTFHDALLMDMLAGELS